MEEGNEQFLMQRIFDLEDKKWFFYGIGVGIVGNLITSYIVQITTEGYNSLNTISKLTLGFSLLFLGLFIYFIKSDFGKKLDVYNLLKDPIMRGYMEAIKIEEAMKIAKNNQEATAMQNPENNTLK